MFFSLHAYIIICVGKFIVKKKKKHGRNRRIKKKNATLLNNGFIDDFFDAQKCATYKDE